MNSMGNRMPWLIYDFESGPEGSNDSILTLMCQNSTINVYPLLRTSHNKWQHS